MRKLIISILSVLIGSTGFAEDYKKEITVHFPANIDTVQRNFSDNEEKLREIVQTIKTIENDSTLEFVDIVFTGYASPDGGQSLNERLSKQRAEAIERYVREQIDIPARVTVKRSTGIAWDELRRIIEESGQDYSQEVTNIINNTPESTYT